MSESEANELTKLEQEHTQIVRAMIKAIGDDPDREGLKDTPARVVRSWRRLFQGYKVDAQKILQRDFESDGYDQMILMGPIEFWSFCEHHILPFSGTATVAYIPNGNGRVVGASKLARVVEAYSRRLQLQERLTKQIAEAIQEAIAPLGVAVVVKARHLCFAARGVEKNGAGLVTSYMQGALRHDVAARAEALRLMEMDLGGER